MEPRFRGVLPSKRVRRSKASTFRFDDVCRKNVRSVEIDGREEVPVHDEKEPLSGFKAQWKFQS